MRLIAAAQLLGVVLLLGAQLAGTGQGYRFTAPYLAGVLLMGTLAATAGVLLLRLRPAGVRLSILLQALQVVNVSTEAFSYQVALGPVFRIHFRPDGWLTQFGAYGNAGIAGHPLLAPSPVFTINLLALGALLALVHHRLGESARAKPVVAAV